MTTTINSNSNNNSNNNNNNNTVPFFVLHLADDRVKALFRVPFDIAETLIHHPILCRGSCFDLTIDVVSSQCRDNDIDNTTKMIHGTCFLSTEYYSPDPEGTAQAIAERIAIRIENPSTASFSNFLG
jgi:hypothetical protein